MSTISDLSPINWLSKTSSRRAFKQICEEYHLVYFGSVNQHSDEHEMVRGVTLSSNHHDRHYCVGTIHGTDVILLERSDTVKFPGRDNETYTWLILQVDLHESIDMPHTFLDAGHHEQAFYDNLFAKFTRLSRVDKSLFLDYDPTFTERFSIYTTPDASDSIPLFVSPESAAVLAHHFNHFDFEWYQDRLVIYSTGRPATKHLVEHMIKAGLWLASELNKSGPKRPA